MRSATSIPCGCTRTRQTRILKAVFLIDANQLGRRNLRPEQMSLLRGRRYNRTKKTHGGQRESSPQNDDLKTAERLAQQHGVSKATIERDGKFAEAVEVHFR